MEWVLMHFVHHIFVLVVSSTLVFLHIDGLFNIEENRLLSPTTHVFLDCRKKTYLIGNPFQSKCLSRITWICPQRWSFRFTNPINIKKACKTLIKTVFIHYKYILQNYNFTTTNMS